MEEVKDLDFNKTVWNQISKYFLAKINYKYNLKLIMKVQRRGNEGRGGEPGENKRFSN